MTFQLRLPNGAKLRLIKINGVPFAVLKCRVHQKRHQNPHDKTSGLSVDTALYPHEYKNLHESSRWANKKNKKREKNAYSQTSRVENQEKLQLNHNRVLFFTVLMLFAQRKVHYWWLVAWLDIRRLLNYPQKADLTSCCAPCRAPFQQLGTPRTKKPAVMSYDFFVI
jgi:hypothetical protein